MTFGPKNAAHEYMSGNAANTAQAKTAIKGKTFIDIVPGGNPQCPAVQTAAVGSYPWAIAGWDADPLIDEGVVTGQRRGAWSVTAGEILAEGDVLAVGAGGKAVKWVAPAHVVGKARGSAVLNGDVAVDVNF